MSDIAQTASGTSEVVSAGAASSGPLHPFTRDVVQCPHPHFAWMRREEPLYRVGDLPFYLVSRYDDVVAVATSPETFLSARSSRGFAAIDYFPTDPEVVSVYAQAPAPYTLGYSDRPDHTRQRKHVARWFTPRMIRAMWQEVIDDTTEELISAFERDGTVDMMKQFAIPLPVRVIAKILGFQDSSVSDLKRWSDAYLKSPAGSSTREDWLRRAYDHVDAQRFLEAQIQDRLAHADKQDLLAALVRETAEGGSGDEEPLTLGEVRSIVNQLLVAGNETTTQLIGQTMHAIVSTPGVLERLQDNPQLVDNAVEEGLRFTTPVTGLYRAAARDVTMAGSSVSKDSILFLLWASANHDETVFTDPEKFDIDRENAGKHIAFGMGIHFCVGANLARAEARTGIGRLVERLPGLRVVPGTELDYGSTLSNRMLETLPMEFDPAPRRARSEETWNS
jgi:cytochrome P450